jgi:uncharacterized protein YjbJ (UPF0337 family)
MSAYLGVIVAATTLQSRPRGSRPHSAFGPPFCLEDRNTESDGGFKRERACRPPMGALSKEAIMDKEHVKGAADKAKGAVKDAAGRMMDDKKLQAEGKMDKAKGSAREALGDAKDAVKRGQEK